MLRISMSINSSERHLVIASTVYHSARLLNHFYSVHLIKTVTQQHAIFLASTRRCNRKGYLHNPGMGVSWTYMYISIVYGQCISIVYGQCISIVYGQCISIVYGQCMGRVYGQCISGSKEKIQKSMNWYWQHLRYVKSKSPLTADVGQCCWHCSSVEIVPYDVKAGIYLHMRWCDEPCDTHGNHKKVAGY